MGLEIVSECGPCCGCGLECGNRLTQRGISVKLKIVRDSRKGWCLFADQLIHRGQFICEYAGELLTTKEARRWQQIYDELASALGVTSNPLSNSIAGLASSGANDEFDEILKATPPALLSFLANLPIVEGPTPNVDIVLSICLQSDIASGVMGKAGTSPATGPAPATSDLSGSSRSHPARSGSSFKPVRDRQSGKRKDLDRQVDDESTFVHSQPLPQDAFRIRQIQKARIGSTSQTGSVSYRSAFSGDVSGSIG